MKIYGLPMSTCTLKALVVLAEKGCEAELVPVDLAKGEHKQAPHLARHPFGRIPVLDDQGFVLYESRAIIRYLEQKLPANPLTPSELQARGLMEQWISVEQSYLSPYVLSIVQQRLLGPMQGLEPDVVVVDRALEQVAKALEIAGRSLATQSYLAGELFTLADVCWMPAIQHLFLVDAGQLVNDTPHVARWWANVTARASWRRATARMGST